MELAATFFYVSAGIAAWVVMGMVAVVAREVAATLKLVQKAAAGVEESVADLALLKKGIRLGVLSLINGALSLVEKKGGKGGAKGE